MGFLDPNREYIAEVYRDGDGADWDTNPYPIVIERTPVTSVSRLALQLAPGGGTAMRIRPVSALTASQMGS
jgi:alpha-glucosidase